MDMFHRLKSYTVFFVTVLTLCSFALPIVFQPAHAHGQTYSVHNDNDCGLMVKKSDTGQDHKQNKSMMHGNCCCGHHCCSVKIIAPFELGFVRIHSGSVALGVYKDQHISGFNINSLYRPPKPLV
jgi:hypothetical protein